MHQLIPVSPAFIFVVLSVWSLACGNETPAPPPQASPQTTPSAPGMLILPFPEHFALARRDLPHFSGSIDVGNETEHGGLRLFDVHESRFGCYSLDDTTAVWEAREGCPEGLVFYSHQEVCTLGEFVFASLYPAGAEYPPAILSVWKIRDDSVDFVAVLDKGFASSGPKTRLSVDRMSKQSSNEYRLSGILQWENDGKRPKLVTRSWSADWTLPNHFELR